MSEMHGRSASEPSEDPANRALVWKVPAQFAQILLARRKSYG